MPPPVPTGGFFLPTGEAAETGNQPVLPMNYTRHYSIPGRATPRPPFPPAPGNLLPFFQESSGCASHDLLVLNPRRDLTPDDAFDAAFEEADDLAFEEVSSTTAFLQRCFAGFQV